MFEPLKRLVRARALRRHASTTPTGIVPLDRIREAVVFIDASTQAVAVLSDDVRAFFAERGIALRILSPQPQELNWYGRIRPPRKGTPPPPAEDLFVSLCAPDNFASTFAAVSSPARFKVGRAQLPGNVYDIVVKDREGVCESAITVFKTMTQLLNQIQ